MRVVIDTNVLVSGLISPSGPPAAVLNAVLKGRVIPLMSAATFAELERVIRRPRLQRYFLRAGVAPAVVLADLRQLAEFISPHRSHDPLRDEGDRPFLDLMATDPPPEFLVTGDKDFDEHRFRGIPVISASLFAKMLRKS